MSLSTDTATAIQQIFVGLLGRPVAQGGLDFWTDAVEADNGFGLTEMMSNIVNEQPEYIDAFSGLTRGQAVTLHFNFLFNRDPSFDAEGRNYWIDGEGAAIPVDQLVLALIQGASAQDQLVLDNQVSVANHITALGTLDNETAKEILDTVTADLDSIDDAIALADAGGVSTFTLTTDIDTLTGTSANDIFNAPLVGPQGAAEQTLAAADEIDGAGGTNRLNATLNADAGAPLLTNIQNLFLRSRDDTAALGLSNTDSAEQVWNDRSIANLTVTGVQNSVELGLNQVAGGTIYDVTYANNASGGAQSVIAQGAGSTTAAVTLSVTDAGTAVTSLAIDAASGVNNIMAGGDLAGITDLTVTGSAFLTLAEAGNFASIENVDASAYTGNLDLDISGQTTADLSVVLGSGDDRLVVDKDIVADDGDAATSVSIDLGEGENTLAVAGVADVDALNFTSGSFAGASTLELTDALALGAAATLDLDGIAPSELVFAGAVSGDVALTLDNVAADLAVTFESTLADTDIDFGNAETVTVNTADAVSGTASFTGESLETLAVNAGADFTATISDAAAASLTSLTLTDTSDAGDTAFSIDLDDTANLSTIDLTGVSGDGAVTINADAAPSAAFAGAVAISVGTGELIYTGDSDVSVREVFTFAGDDINVITLNNFEAGAGANRDRLDFSQFEGISSSEDLNIVQDAGNAVISAADGQFDGSITLTGVQADAALSESLIF